MNKELINKNPVFIGYASTFNNIDEHGDIILPGAFKDFLKKNKPQDIKLLWQHKQKDPIGKIVDIFEDNQGLLIKAELVTEVQTAKEAHALIKNHAILGLSIGFRVVKALRHKTKNHRIISEIDLLEVSLVTFPANKKSQIMFVSE